MAISARELTLILRVQSAGAQNIRRLSSDLNSLERSGQGLNQRMLTASRAVGAVGRQLQLVGGIGTFALALAANQAADLQTKVTLAATQVANSVSGVRSQATKDFNGILAQMGKFPSTADDMSRALYDVYSTLNVNGKQGIGILQQINKAAVAGGLSSQDAANGLLSVASNFNKGNATIKSTRSEFNRMFAAVRYGRATMADFSTALQTTSPAAKIAGQSLNSMAGTFAFLSRSLGPHKAAVSYARLVEVLSGTQMQDGLKKMGVNIDNSNGKMKQMDEVISILVKRFPYLAQGGIKALNFFKDIGNIQSTIQARRAFATLTHNVAGYKDILHKTVKDNNEFSKSYKTMSQSLGVQWQVFLNTLKSIGIAIGMTVIPAFLEMAKPLRQAVTWFQNLDPAIKSTIGRIAAFLAVGALVGGTLLTIAAGIGGVLFSLGELGAAFAILGTGLLGYGGLAVIGKKIYENWDGLSGIFKKVAMDLKNVLAALGAAAAAFYHDDWNAVWSHLGDAIKAAIPAVKDALNAIGQTVWAWGKDFVTTMTGAITAGLAGMIIASKRRGAVGAGGGRLLEGLATADLMAPFLGASAGPIGMATKAAAKTDDLKALAKYMPFMSTQERMALDELQTRQKISNSWKSQVGRMADAMTKRKQLAALDALEARKLYSFSNVATGRTQVMRTTGGFASAAESTAALAIMNRAPAATGLVEQGAAAAALSFGRLGSSIKGAGASLLRFIGFGNVWVGAAVAFGAAAFLIYKWMNSIPSAFDRASKGIKDFKTGLQTATTSLHNAVDAQVQLNAAKLTLKEQTQQVAHYKKIVESATVGSKAYKNAESNLNAAQQARVTTVNQLAAAQQNLNASLSQSSGGLAQASSGLTDFFKNAPDVRAIARSAANVPTAAQATGAAYNRSSSSFTQAMGAAVRRDAIDNLKTLNAEGRKAVAWIPKAASSLNLFALAGGKLASGKGAEVLKQYADVLSKVLVGTTKLSPQIQQLSNVMNHAVSPAMLQAFADIPKKIMPGAMRFMQTAHTLPGTTTTAFLQGHKQIQQSAGALIGTLGHLPSTQQTTFLVDHKRADSQIADYIKKFHQLPDKKHMTIILNTVQAQHKVQETVKHVAQLQRNLHQVGRIQPQLRMRDPKLTVDTSLFDRNIAKGRRELSRLDSLVTKPHSKNYNIKWHPSLGAAAGQAKSLGASLDAGVAAGISSNSVLLNSAMAAAVQGAVAAGAKAAQTGSPSKLAMKKIGDPILQGILAPLKKKKDIQDAANTAVQNMIDAFSTARDTYKGQMGDLFTGPSFMAPNRMQDSLQTKLAWGEKVNVKDVTGDLRAQVRQFSHFERSVNRLNRRRGTSFAMIDEIRQLGPSAQAEVNALLNATPRQLKKYERLWERSQKAINATAKRTVKGQVAEWRKQGAAVALGFMQGMTDHSARMARFFKTLFLHLFQQVKKTHKSHSPSQLYMQEGMNVALGFQLGVQRGMHPLHMHPRLRPVGGFGHARPLVSHVTNNYYNKTYNVYPQKEENLLSALRKHDYVSRIHP